MPSQRSWRGATALGVVLVATAALLTASTAPTAPAASADVGQLTAVMAAADSVRLAEAALPAEYARLSPAKAAARLAADPRLAVERTAAVPDPDAADPLEAGLARLTELAADTPDEVARAYAELPVAATAWLPVVFPGAVGNLTGAAYPDRIAANRVAAAAAVAGSGTWPGPDRPWNERREPRRDLSHLLDPGRQLLGFDLTANDRMGAWIDVHGDLDTARHIAVLVPGGSAFITTGEPGPFAASGNFGRYASRADSFVAAANGDLAVIVWAAAESPSGWIDEADPSWSQDAAPRLVDFLDDLHRQLPEPDVTVVGHSYGGAVLGLAEVEGFAADRVLYVASAGAGHGVDSPSDFDEPCRPRYSMMAPGDPISYVQDIPGATGLGHGAAVSDLPGVIRLTTGHLPDDPTAVDDVGRTLGSQGITGKRIAGIHAHSEVFVPHSRAWRNMLAVFTMGDPRAAERQPAPDPNC